MKSKLHGQFTAQVVLRSLLYLQRLRWTATSTVLISLRLFFPQSADAGEIHPLLSARMDALIAGEKISVILVLADQAPIDEISKSLSLRRATRQDRHREVVEALQETAARTQGPVLEQLDQLQAAGRIADYTAYWIANLIVVHGDRSAIVALAARGDVAQAELNFEIALISPTASPGETLPSPGESARAGGGEGVPSGIRVIRADQVWYETGVTGQNTLVANLDTGVDGSHPALSGRWRGQHTPWQHAWHDVLGTGTTFPTDNNAHGTHVMGTMTGLGAETGDSIGVAPGAEWIAANACNQSAGQEFDNDVIDCYQWFADPDGNGSTVDDVPDVVQNSWGVRGLDYYACDARWWSAIDNLEAAGTVLTFSAGNGGPAPLTMLSPADRASTPLNAFSVGAIDGRGSFPYPIAPFSSRGPSGCPGSAIKPELVAPGMGIYSSIPGGGYFDGWQGTSLAGPHVAGVVALMRSVDPNLEVETIKQILLDTAVDLGAVGDDNSYGWGVPDAYAAVLAVGGSAGTPIDGLGSSTYLHLNSPNPFAGSTTIRFALSEASPVRVSILDVQGRLIRVLIDEVRGAGVHVLAWDGRDRLGHAAPAGIYLFRMEATGFTAEHKLLRVR